MKSNHSALPIGLRGRSIMALIMAPQLPLQTWLEALDIQMSRSPNFLDARPVVLDLSGIPPEQQGVAEFVQGLEKRGLWIMSIEGAHPTWKNVSVSCRVSPRDCNQGQLIEVASERLPLSHLEPANTSPRNETHAMIVDHPIRSGQMVVFERGDVTVRGSVASGAEVVAGGSIHIYGTLRGRALAGIGGNPGARIFCRQLQAELLAIDGVYQTADDISKVVWGKAVEVRLGGERLKISLLE